MMCRHGRCVLSSLFSQCLVYPNTVGSSSYTMRHCRGTHRASRARGLQGHLVFVDSTAKRAVGKVEQCLSRDVRRNLWPCRSDLDARRAASVETPDSALLACLGPRCRASGSSEGRDGLGRFRAHMNGFGAIWGRMDGHRVSKYFEMDIAC